MKNAITAASSASAPTPTPTPIPIFEPCDSPLGTPVGVELTVLDSRVVADPAELAEARESASIDNDDDDGDNDDDDAVVSAVM